MALEYPDVEVLGVSIVSGNMPVEQGSINARYTIELCEKNVPVYVGSDKPMVKKREHADWFHGPDGMGNMNYPDPQLNEDDSDYMDILQSLVEQYPNEINALMRDETNWTHGFNSGCLAAFRFCERALNPSMELDDYFLEELLDEDVFETDTPLEEAEEMFPELDT